MSQLSDILEITYVIPENVITRYSEPHRKYHTVDHLKYMLRVMQSWFLGNVNMNTRMREALVWAIFYHDYVYSVPDVNRVNEQSSAELFLIEHNELPRAFQISKAILATKTHILEDGDNSSLNRYLIDLDLWALGDIVEYTKNNALIKAEVGASNKEWIEGRGNWLESFLKRDQIYYTPMGKSREHQARKILQDDLNSLRGLN